MWQLQQQHGQTRLPDTAADGLRHFTAQQRLMPLQLRAIRHRSAPADASACRHPRGSPWKKAQTHLPVPGSTPEYRRSDPHGPALTGCSSHHNPVRARRDDDHHSTCRQSRRGIPRQDLSQSPAHALWHRDPDNETVTPGCVRSGSDPAGTVPKPNSLLTAASVALIPAQIASTVLFRVEN